MHYYIQKIITKNNTKMIMNGKVAQFSLSGKKLNLISLLLLLANHIMNAHRTAGSFMAHI